jgi:Domain of unknown function (DUF4129)
VNPVSALLAAVAAEVPVDLDRDEAREAARRELSKTEYVSEEPSPLQRLVNFVLGKLEDLLAQLGSGNATTGFVGLVVIVLLVVVTLVALRLKLGPFRPRADRRQALFAGRELTARDHRTAAEAHAAAGQWAEAVRERFRAVVREFEQRGLLDPRPGRTADEAAAEAGAVLPVAADRLRAAARVFDDVWYGGRAATREMYAQLREVDDIVLTSRRGVPQGVG